MSPKNRFLDGVGSVVDIFPGTAKFTVLPARNRSDAKAIRGDMKRFGTAMTGAIAKEMKGPSLTAEKEEALGFRVRMIPLSAEKSSNAKRKRPTRPHGDIRSWAENWFGVGKRKKPKR